MMGTSRRKKRVWIGGCLLILILAIAVPTAVLWYIVSTTDDGTAALRAKGYPTTVEELDDWFPDPPPGENVADFYSEAGALLDGSTFEDLDWVPTYSETELPELGTPFFDDDLAAIAAFLKHESAAFDLIDEAIGYETGRLPTNLISAATVNLNVFHASKGQWLRVLYLIDADEPDAAIAAMEGLTHMVRAQSQDPSLGSLMLANLIAYRSMDATERLLDRHDPTNEQLATLDRHLSELMVEKRLLHALIRERCITRDLIAQPGGSRIPFVQELILDGFSRMASDYIEIAEGGFPDRIDNYRTLVNRPRSWLSVYVHIMEPPYSGSVQQHYETVARVALTRLAVAIEQAPKNGLQLNELPPTDAVDNWPIDPFSGKPIQYKRVGEGYILYSVGRNFIDDGGQREHGLDIVFRVLR